MKLKQVLLSFDQLVNVVCAGYADETLSARAYRNREKTRYWAFWYAVFNKMFFWQNNHCRGAYNDEVIRKHYPRIYRKEE